MGPIYKIIRNGGLLLIQKAEVLKEEFPGEAAWKNFYEIFKDNWSNVRNKDDYLQVIPDEAIAMVIAVRMGVRGLDWFLAPCPALDGNTPQDIFHSSEGAKAIKTLVMRMH